MKPQRAHVAVKASSDRPEGLGFWDIRRGQCHWPLTNEPSIYDFRYCGAKALAGTSWCAEHA